MNAYILTRRELLQLCGASGVIYLFGGMVSKSQTLLPAKTAVDHLLLGVANLDQGITWFERMTGVKAIIGGSHPGVGTRNALISLGDRQYLEIIAPDPLQTSYNFFIDLRTLAEPKLITWAAITTDIMATAKNVREAGYQISGPRDGSRTRPDGKILKWKTMGVLNKSELQGVEPIPFFIEWANDSLHPSQDSPSGCALQSFEMEHPDPMGVIDTLKKLGIEAKVEQAKEVRLKVVLKTPKGKVELS
ncbi:MAG: VOC family protein [Acidobacteriota bacterium]